MDGYFAISDGGDDCNDNDPNINPGAQEVCNNSADDNCNGLVNEDTCPEGSFLDPTSCVCVTPIILSLAGGSLALTDVAGGVYFDINGDGVPERLSWTAPGATDAFLVLDINGNGTIDDGTELFGNFTRFPGRRSFGNGFEVLRYLDSPAMGGDFDGAIDEKDSVYSRLWLWIDSNHNGFSEPAELFLFANYVQSISCTYFESRHQDRFGNIYRYRGKAYLKGGQGRFAYDVFLLHQ